MMLSLILSLSILASPAVAQCSRSLLQQGADGYLATVKSGKTSLATTDTVEYTENFKKMGLDSGYHSGKVNVGFHRHLLDTTACATYSEIIAPESAIPYVVGVQIRYGPDGKASKIEAVVNSNVTGSLFDAKETHKWAAQEKRDVIPEAQRDSRSVIQGVADVYLNKFSDAAAVIPRHDSCERLEGKMHVAPNCVIGINSHPDRKMIDRRYVIDETVGTVSVILSFDGVPDSHEFRVEGGKLKYVHAMTAGRVTLPKGLTLPKGIIPGKTTRKMVR